MFVLIKKPLRIILGAFNFFKMKLNIKLKRKDFEDLTGKTFLVESIGYTWEHKIIDFENNYNLVKISVRRVLKIIQ